MGYRIHLYTISGQQCALKFFHPRTAARLSDSKPLSTFYWSGVVWFEPTRSLEVELRIPEEFDDRVMEVFLRPAALSSGEFLSLVHYGMKCDGATDVDFDTIINAVKEVLQV